MKREAGPRGLAPPSAGLAVALGAAWLVASSSVPVIAGEDDQVRLEVSLTAAETGAPIPNATVYVKFKEERLLRRDKKREWSLKTNPDGKAVFPPLPAGQVLVMVVAPGWKTYGSYHSLQGPKKLLEIKLNPPKKWY